MLIIHLHLVPRLRIHGAVPPLFDMSSGYGAYLSERQLCLYVGPITEANKLRIGSRRMEFVLQLSTFLIYLEIHVSHMSVVVKSVRYTSKN
jgi:hypothetical protein